MTETMRTIAAWRIIDRFGDVIQFGVEEEPYEFDLDHLPGGWGADRNISAVQKTMAIVPLWAENGYKFEYQLYDLGDDMSIEKRGE